jgi:hypothetical protein
MSLNARFHLLLQKLESEEGRRGEFIIGTAFTPRRLQ